MDIHRQLGHGFLEAVYQEAAVVEFRPRNIPFEREALLPVKYKGNLLPVHYRADFVCFSEIIVEFKAISILTTGDEAQVLNYLKATGYHRGLLFNKKDSSGATMTRFFPMNQRFKTTRDPAHKKNLLNLCNLWMPPNHHQNLLQVANTSSRKKKSAQSA